MPLTRLIYVSRPTEVLSGPDFLAVCDDILAVSRRKNAEAAITGALIASPDVFVQVLEGRRLAVSRTFARICRDERHYDVEILESGEVEYRVFGEWSMSFCDRSRIDDALTRRYRHGHALDLPRLSPSAMLGFIEEAVRQQASDNSILGAPVAREVPDDVVFADAAE